MRLVRVLALATLAGCAQYGGPPGGAEDERAPQVVATEPEPFAVVPDFTGDVVIRFDERLSERQVEQSIMVSPQTGDVQVDHRGDQLRVRIDGGWRRNQIYRVILRPGLFDLFGNQRMETAELVFSTGPPIPATALAGELTERITGSAPEVGYVHAVRRADSVVYTAIVESDGFFSALNLPNGIYDVVGFVDANRNERRDPGEASSPARQVSLSNDTAVVMLAALPFDTTAARPLTATADSMHVRVTFDDALDPEMPSDSMRALIYTAADTSALLNAFEVLWPWEYTERLAAARAAADTLAADTLGARADSAQGAAAPTAPLPTREVVVVPRRPLAPGDYIVEVTGAVNVNGYRGGGGRVRVSVPAPTAVAPADSVPVAPADTVPVDTIIGPDGAHVFSTTRFRFRSPLRFRPSPSHSERQPRPGPEPGSNATPETAH